MPPPEVLEAVSKKAAGDALESETSRKWPRGGPRMLEGREGGKREVVETVGDEQRSKQL